MVIRISFKGRRVLSFWLGRPGLPGIAPRNPAPLACWLSRSGGQESGATFQTFALGFAVLLLCTAVACRAQAEAGPKGLTAPPAAGSAVVNGPNQPPGRF